MWLSELINIEKNVIHLVFSETPKFVHIINGVRWTKTGKLGLLQNLVENSVNKHSPNIISLEMFTIDWWMKSHVTLDHIYHWEEMKQVFRHKCLHFHCVWADHFLIPGIICQSQLFFHTQFDRLLNLPQLQLFNCSIECEFYLGPSHLVFAISSSVIKWSDALIGILGASRRSSKIWQVWVPWLFLHCDFWHQQGALGSHQQFDMNKLPFSADCIGGQICQK